MQNSDSSERYTTTAIALHWLIAGLVLGMIGFGWWMQQIPKYPVGQRVNAFNLHKSIGLSILVLMLVRTFWRATHPPPSFPPMPAWQVRSARTVHVLLYVCLFLQPLTGYLGSVYSGYPVRFFGVVLPAWAPKVDGIKDAMSVAHLVNSWILVTALVLHVGATLKHALIDRDRVFRRIWPWGDGLASNPGNARSPG